MLASYSPLVLAPATDLLNPNLSWNNIAGKPVTVSLFATNVNNQHSTSTTAARTT